MNLLERIEQVQYGRNEIFTGVKEKQGLRDKLNDEVEAFLKRGGKVKEIPIGYSSYRDGKVPMRGITRGPKEKLEYDPSIQETPNEVIEARNNLIKGKKHPVDQRKRGKDIAKIGFQKKYLSELNKKFGPKDKENLCQIVGIQKSTFDNAKCGSSALSDETFQKLKYEASKFNFTKPKPVKGFNKFGISEKEVARKKSVNLAKNEAIKSGLNRFEAECSRHGFTTYSILGNGRALCLSCNRENIEKYRRKKTADIDLIRQRNNRELFNLTMSLGKTSFIGWCCNCGETEMRIRKNKGVLNNYFCYACSLQSRKKYREKRKAQNESKANA